jgi:transposase
MLRMDQVHVIRHKVLREGASIQQVARELDLSRDTVSKCLEQSADLGASVTAPSGSMRAPNQWSAP